MYISKCSNRALKVGLSNSIDSVPAEYRACRDLVACSVPPTWFRLRWVGGLRHAANPCLLNSSNGHVEGRRLIDPHPRTHNICLWDKGGTEPRDTHRFEQGACERRLTCLSLLYPSLPKLRTSCLGLGRADPGDLFLYLSWRASACPFCFTLERYQALFDGGRRGRRWVR